MNSHQPNLVPLGRGEQERLPNRRRSTTQKVRIGGSASCYLHMGEYPDGRLGEIFIEIAKQGSFTNGIMDAFATLVSKSLQYGIPLEELCDSFINTNFEPSGAVEGDDTITEARSILDYIFRHLKEAYLSDSRTTSNS